MANGLRYTLTTSAPGREKGVLCVVVGYKGKSSCRQTFAVQKLQAPNFKLWDKAIGRFKGRTEMARENNAVLNELCTQCDGLLKDPAIKTPFQFIEALKGSEDKKSPVEILTFGGFVKRLIHEMRTGANNKRPSRNYQIYTNLLHKLEKEKHILNQPLEDITNAHFIRFSDFLLTLPQGKGGSNYLNLMKLFKQVHKKAYDRELNGHILKFRYTDAAPMYDETEKLPSLSIEQYTAFCNLDLSQVYQSGINRDFYKELYRDFCVFLYETKMRPVDVIRAHINNVETHNGKQYLKYIPEKKKNSRQKNKVVYAPLSEVANQIVAKYERLSIQGYIFPFSMNDYKWDFNDVDSWNTWNNRKAHALNMINKWLKKVQELLGIGFPVTLYTFRRSALTHACMADGANFMKIALDGGTSPDMLLKNYVSNFV